MKTILFSSTTGDIPADLAFINNLSATVDPGVNDDSTKRYSRGSSWINKTSKIAFVCVDDSVGAAQWNETGFSATPGQVVAEPASTPTGNGGGALLKGGSGGTTSGNGGGSSVLGGDAVAGNGNGGDVNVVGGTANGTGVNGVARLGGVVLVTQGAPASQDTAAQLTASQILAGILTSNPSGAVNVQLPLATAMDTALPSSGVGDAFDFSVISIAGSTNLPTITTATGWTLVGAMTFTAVAGNAGRFRARKTAAGAWTLYRLS